MWANVGSWNVYIMCSCQNYNEERSILIYELSEIDVTTFSLLSFGVKEWWCNILPSEVFFKMFCGIYEEQEGADEAPN